MAIAGVVILYHPDDNVIQNIRSYLPHLDRLYIADNTEHNISAVAAYFSTDDKVKMIYDGNNNGIAKRLNEAAVLAIEEEYNWLLTMDQDSHFEEGVLPDYLLCAGTYLHKDATAMFGVEYEEKPQETTNCLPVETNKLITSGSILNLTLYKDIGGFNERLFIDEVDFDYCFRARLKNYLVVQLKNIFLHHSLGNTSQHRSLQSMKLTKRSLHSPKRMYYMVRNYLYLSQHFKKHFPDDIALDRKMLLNRIKNNLLYNSGRTDVLLNICKGYLDFKRDNY